MMTVVGGVLAALGLVSGILLVLAPLGVGGAEPGYITWGMFPVLSILGYTFMITSASSANVALLSRVMGGITLLLALGAIVAIFAADNGLIAIHSSLSPLWYVVVLGIVFGTTGLAVAARVQQELRQAAVK